MTVGALQRRFARLVGHLILKVYAEGYECSLDWAYRPPECAEHLAKAGKGIRSSNHTKRLALDLMLFKDGEFLTDAAAYQWLGDWWTAQDPDARWGGNFTSRDAVHFSFEFEGVQ